MTDRESLRALIGGRWAVSWPGYLLGLPFAVGFTFFSFPSAWAAPTLTERLARGIGLGVVAYAAAGVVFWLASVTVLRHRREWPAPVTLVAVVGGVAWTARGIAIEAHLVQRGLTSYLSPVRFGFIGFFEGVVAAVLAAWVLATLESFQKHRRRLVAQLVAQELASSRHVAAIELLRAEVAEKARSTVREAVRPTAATTNDQHPSVNDLFALNDASQRIAREFARDLWERAERSSKLRPTAVVRSAVANRPFALWAFLPTFVVSVATLSSAWPVGRATMLLLTLTAFSTAVSLAANATTPRMNRRTGTLAYATAVLALFLGSPVIVLIALPVLGLVSPSGLAILPITALNFGVLIPLLGLTAHVGTAQREVLQRLRRSIDDAEVQREALRGEETRVIRELAVSLHGGLQAQLTALSLRLQNALAEGDQALAQTFLDEARVAIDEAFSAREATVMTAQEVIDSVVLAWSGLIDITARCETDAGLHPDTLRSIEDVLLEGIGNAVRHGDARRVVVEVLQRGPWLMITVADDGLGSGSGSGSGDEGRGLGSEMLDEIAPGAWHLARAHSGGSTLTVNLPAR